MQHFYFQALLRRLSLMYERWQEIEEEFCHAVAGNAGEQTVMRTLIEFLDDVD